MESGSPQTHLEHEAKLIAAASFRMPTLDGAAPWLVIHEPRHEVLKAAYFDTSDLALIRAGITLRHRRANNEGSWTLKFPVDTNRVALVRQEISFTGARGRVPVGAIDLTRAVTRFQPLTLVARLNTARTIVELHDAHGQLAVEVVDDNVSVYEGSRCTMRFREIEVELHSHTKPSVKALQAIVERLVAAGAVPEQPQSKLARGLGDRTKAPADVEHEVLSARDWKHADTRQLVRHVLCASVIEMIRHDAGVRLDLDPEHLHAYRVATRQLRSNLRTYSPLLDPEWTAALRAELAWLGASLGAVREADVLSKWLQSQHSTLPRRHRRALGSIAQHLTDQRVEARRVLLADMRSPRYDRLIDQLCQATRQPSFNRDRKTHLERSALEVGPRFTRRTWRTLQRAVDAAAAADNPSVDTLHKIRIYAKRCRYAAEALGPAIGKPVRRFAQRLSELQGTLGELHDADVAERWLGEAAQVVPGAAECVDYLIALVRTRRKHAEDEWPPMVRDLADSKKLAAWLNPK